MGAVAIVAALHAAPAAAQGSAQDQATARTLFNESRELMKSGRYEEACAKLEGASRLYAGSGVLLNLGDCYEHLGRTASAWTEFGEAASAAERASRPEDLAEAKRRQAAVEPKLSRLVIRVPREVPGLVVKRDGTAIDRVAWGEGIPVDPGAHAISAEADGYVRWTGSATAEGAGRSVSIDVPPLEPIPVAPPVVSTVTPPAATTPDTATAPTAGYWTSRRVASASIAGLGIVGVGVGGIVALVAKSNDTTAENETGPQRHADSVSAANMGNVASIVMIGSGVVAAGGLALWLTAPNASVQVGTTGRAVVVWGAF